MWLLAWCILTSNHKSSHCKTIFSTSLNHEDFRVQRLWHCQKACASIGAQNDNSEQERRFCSSRSPQQPNWCWLDESQVRLQGFGRWNRNSTWNHPVDAQRGTCLCRTQQQHVDLPWVDWTLEQHSLLHLRDCKQLLGLEPPGQWWRNRRC